MLAEALAKIEVEKKGTKGDSLAAVIALLLMELSRRDMAVAAAVAKSKLTIEGCAKHFTAYAQKHKSGNAFGMTQTVAEKLIRDYYSVGTPEPVPESTAKPEPPIAAAGASINILDLL